MPRITAEHKAAMRDRILQAAIAVVRSKGLARLTIGDVITESGLSAGAIYGYYRSKDDLVVDVARTVMTGRLDAVQEMATRTPVPSPTQALPELLAGVPTDWLRGGMLLQLWGAAGTDDQLLASTLDMVAALQGGFQTYLEAWLRQEGHDEDAARRRALLLRPAVTGLVQGYVLQASVDPLSDLERYVDSATTLLAEQIS